MTLLSSRTLPGHRLRATSARASGVSTFSGTSYSRHARSRNRSASSTVSPARSRRGGRRTVSTASRW